MLKAMAGWMSHHWHKVRVKAHENIVDIAWSINAARVVSGKLALRILDLESRYLAQLLETNLII